MNRDNFKQKLGILYSIPVHEQKKLIYGGESCYANNNKSLFKKYSWLVTAFANHQLGRDFLGISNFKEKIGLLLPNGYHAIQGEGSDVREMYAEFYTRPFFAPKLYPALMKLDAIQPFISHFKEALEFLYWSAGLIKRGQIAPSLARSIALSIGSYYPDGSPESTSVDGFIGNSGTTYATVQAATTGNTAIDSGAVDANILHNTFYTPTYYVYRVATLFDTSSLPDAAGVKRADYSLWFSGKANTDSDSVRVVSSSPATNTALITDDFDQFGTTGLAADKTIAGITTGGYTAFALNTTGLAAVNKSGITKLGVRLVKDCTATTPTGGNTLTGFFREYNSGNSKPTITAYVTDDIYTTSLLHFDAAEGSTTMTDESGKIWSAHGHANVAATPVFGIGSLTMDNSADGYIDTPDTDDHEPGAGDFTVDYVIDFQDTSGLRAMFGRRTDSNGDGSGAQRDFFGAFTNAADNTLHFDAIVNNVNKCRYYCSWAPSVYTWYHLAFVRKGSNFYIFIDGVPQTLTATQEVGTNDLTFSLTGEKLTLGRYGNYNGFYVYGLIDEFRFSKGIARWTSKFTKPTQAYPLATLIRTTNGVIQQSLKKVAGVTNAGTKKFSGIVNV